MICPLFRENGPKKRNNNKIVAHPFNCTSRDCIIYPRGPHFQVCDVDLHVVPVQILLAKPNLCSSCWRAIQKHSEITEKCKEAIYKMGNHIILLIWKHFYIQWVNFLCSASRCSMDFLNVLLQSTYEMLGCKEITCGSGPMSLQT